MILERDKKRRSWRTPCGTEAMSDAVAAQKRPGPFGESHLWVIAALLLGYVPQWAQNLRRALH